MNKSPACRQEGESKSECISRKVPEILDENPGMSNEQAVAIAENMCSEKCSKKLLCTLKRILQFPHIRGL